MKIHHYNFVGDHSQHRQQIRISPDRSKHLMNSSITNGVNITTATSISNDEYIVSNINSNRSLLQKNPPLYYQKSSPSYNIGLPGYVQKETTYYNIPIVNSFKNQKPQQLIRNLKGQKATLNNTNTNFNHVSYNFPAR